MNKPKKKKDETTDEPKAPAKLEPGTLPTEQADTRAMHYPHLPDVLDTNPHSTC
jgi:hypothetical protein